MDEAAIIFEYFMQLGMSGVMLDVGAHHGKTALPFLEAGWDAYAFEPDPDNYKVLVDSLGSYETFYADNRAVADKTFESLPFYTSPISSGISSLCSFHETHELSYEIQTVCLSQFCHEMNIQEVDLLKIDTEGFDLFVLNGIDWKNCRPKVIICEFEDAKTTILSYSFVDIAKYLEANGYSLIISEWYPVTHYGGQHSWRCFHRWPCQIHDNKAWGNILAFSKELDLIKFTNAIGAFADNNAKTLPQSPRSLPQQALENGLQAISEITNAHLRRCWTELLKYKNIHTVFLLGMGAHTKRLLKITEGIPGPEILGIVDTQAFKDQTFNGISVLKPDQVNGCTVDAIVLSMDIFQKRPMHGCFEGLSKNKPIVDLYEGFPRLHYSRLIRDMYLASGNLNSAENSANNILNFLPEEQDFEIYYKIGLEFHKENNMEQARAVYEKVASDARVKPDLAAWALFKHGELLLDQGQEEAAQSYFGQALHRNPSHPKAAIFHTPISQPLRVCLSTDNSCIEESCIAVPMDPLNDELWAYYFSHRSPNYVSLRLIDGFQIKHLPKLLQLICKYLAPGGIALVNVYGEEVLPYYLKKFTEISHIFDLCMHYDDTKKAMIIKKSILTRQHNI
jgi:FkbM family methyltransferase